MTALREGFFRSGRVLRAVVVAVVVRPAHWFISKPDRLVVLTWMVMLMCVGHARMTDAASIIVGPDLAHGGPKTLLETYDFLNYKLLVKPTDAASGWFGVGTAVLEVIGFLNNLIMWACLGIIFGGLTLLQWFLQLTVYQDASGEIDRLVQMIGNHVFWPLMSATVAIGAFLAYAKWRGDGRSFLSDFGWVAAATLLAVGFATGPSTIMGTVDGTRQAIGTGIISGATDYVRTVPNPTGFGDPQIGGNPGEAATRKLVDGLWKNYAVTPWCYAMFDSLDVCKVAGHHALADDGQWKNWMDSLNKETPIPEFGGKENWIRGQDMTRTGSLLLLAALTLPLGWMLLRLVIAGLIAVVGVLLMLAVGLVFLTFWAIPGWFRQTGTKYWLYTLGLQLQALFVTVVIASVMAVSTMISTITSRNGLFLLAILNLALLTAATKARSWLEMLTSLGGAGSMGAGAAMLARTAAGGLLGAARRPWSAAMGAAATLAGRGLGLAATTAGAGLGVGALAGRTATAAWKNRTRGLSDLDSRSPIFATATAHPYRPAGKHAALGAAQTPTLPRGTPLGLSAGADRTSTLPVHSGSGQYRQSTAPGPKVEKPDVSADATVTKNVAAQQKRAGHRGRVWVHKPGQGLSALEPVKPKRDKTFPITSARTWPRKK